MDVKDINKKFFQFISDHIKEDPIKLRLKAQSKELGFDVKLAITQIECRQKASKKLKTILMNDKFLFPSTLLSEQCTDEIIAKFHASLFENCTNILDITAGLCIDSYFISLKGIKVTALEMVEESACIDDFNMKNLDADVTVVNSEASEFLKYSLEKYDAIYADPARRDSCNKKVFGLEECSPNIIEIIPLLKAKADFVIVKASPMIDISDTLNKIPEITDIWIVGLKNECKELLFKIDFKNQTSTCVHTINFLADNKYQEFNYSLYSNEKSVNFRNPIVGDYMYEPNVCIMKSGAFNQLVKKYPILYAIHDNSHLFLSEEELNNFPGRSFVIEEIIPFKEKLLKSIGLKHPQINVSTRNFRLSSDQLKSKLKVKDGSDKYLFGTTLKDNSPVIIICSRFIS